MSLYAGNCSEHVCTLLIGYRSGGTPGFHTLSGRVTELRAVDEGAVPASAPATSRLFVLPVAARRWVSTDNTRTSPAPPPRSLLPLSRRPHLSALSSPPCRASVCWPGRASRRTRALGHLRHVYSPTITAASSARGLLLLEPGTLGTDRTGSVVRIRNHRGCVTRTPWRLPAPS